MMLASIWTNLLALAILFVSFLLICLILLQKNRGSGLSGAFGGAGGQSAFGTKTGDVLTWTTVGLTAFFLILCISANLAFTPAEVQLPPPPPPPVTPTPPTATAVSTAPAASTRPVRITPILSPAKPGDTPVNVTPSPTTNPPPATAPAGGS